MRAVVALFGLLITVAVIVALRLGLDSTWEPPERVGPAGMVKAPAGESLWLLVKREEHKQVANYIGRFADFTNENRYHFELHVHDPVSGQPTWGRWLAMVKDDEGGHASQARILGQDGDAVWLFLHDQPIALSSRDATTLVDRAALERRNPALQGLLSADLATYAFDGNLIVTAADGRLFKLPAPDFVATPYVIENKERFQYLQFMSTRWNGGWNTKDFTVRQASLGGRWLGLYTEREAADAGDDAFGTSLADPASILDEGDKVRRGLWSARIGQTKKFTEGSHDRLLDVARLPDAPDFLAGRFLIRAGTREPLQVANPSGIVVLHRTRVDADGRVGLTRLDERLRPVWSATLPVSELNNRWEYPDRLLMIGAVQVTDNGATRWQEHLVSLDLGTGRTRSWNLTRETAEPSVEAGS